MPEEKKKTLSLLSHHSNDLFVVTQDWLRDEPVPKSQDVAHHGHDGQRSSVIGPPVEPHLRKKQQQGFKVCLNCGEDLRHKPQRATKLPPHRVKKKSNLRARALEPQELGQVVSCRVVDGVLEHLHLLHQRQVVVVWSHLNNKEKMVIATWIKCQHKHFKKVTLSKSKGQTLRNDRSERKTLRLAWLDAQKTLAQ